MHTHIHTDIRTYIHNTYINTYLLTDIPHNKKEVQLLQFPICNAKTATNSGQMVQHPKFLSR